MDNDSPQRREFLARSGQWVVAAAAGSGGLATAKSATPSYLDLSAAAAVEHMRKGDFKAEAYAQALLARAEGLAGLNAFRTLDRDKVLSAARSADRSRAANKKLGRMHGLPVPVKDSVNVQGLAVTNGTGALRDVRPKEDAPLVQRMKEQGAIVMGKTNLHELSFGWTSNNDVYGPVRNPYAPGRIPGGSSGGSGVAVAGRMAPMAVAEDTLGSIRVPASCCGLVGLRPTFGRYPNKGTMPLTTDKFDQVGPLARSVADIALFDAAVTGQTTPLEAPNLKGVRIGVLPDSFAAGLDRHVGRVYNESLRRLRDAGVELIEARTPEAMQAPSDIAFAIIGYETQPTITEFLRENQLGITFGQLFDGASASMRDALKLLALAPNRPKPEDYQAALVKRAALQKSVRDLYQDLRIAALVFPPMLAATPRIGEETELEIDGKKVPLFMVMGRNTALGSCASLSSLVMPAGADDQGIPIGLEFCGLPGSDRAMLSLGLSLERVLDKAPSPKI